MAIVTAYRRVVPPAHARSRYLSLLQIAATLPIMAFHLGVRHTHWGWIMVELFFAIAGMNMAKSIARDRSIGAYALTRIRRLGPIVLVVWVATVLFVLAGFASFGMLWFLATAPLFAQNLSLPFFHYVMPNDWVFGPLWFVAALVQLQVVLFVARKLLLRLNPLTIAALSFVAGLGFRLLFAQLVGDDLGALTEHQADVLYCLPFTHLEAIVLGLLVGRGQLPRLGRFLPWLALAVLGLELVVSLRFPLHLHFAHVWGYSILAVAAASLCASKALPAIVERPRLPGWMDGIVFKAASLTYGAYAFHGLVMATGWNGAAAVPVDEFRGIGLILLVVTAVQSFMLAWMVDIAARFFEEHRASLNLNWLRRPGLTPEHDR